MSNAQSQKSEKPEKVITITLDKDGLPVANPDPAPVQKDNQKVRWCADFEFKVSIDGYADKLDYHAAAANAEYPYRCTSSTFGDTKKYKYSITANGKTNDPELDVKP